MDIKVITRHAPANYGSLLQSIATVKLIEQLGHSCEIIDYIREDEKGFNAIKTLLNNKSKWDDNVIKRLLFILLRYPESFLAERKFNNMRSRYLKLTRRYSRINELSDLKADIFMTGSDQVWGPTLNGEYDEAYFLSFVENSKKTAYAASFGRTDFNTTIMAKYSEMLTKYDSITVREDSAVLLLKDMGVTCAGQVLDPTLLLSEHEWQQFIENDHIIKEQYVLVYQLHNNPVLSDYAMRFAKHVGLPLYRVSPTFHQFKRGGHFLYLPELGDFLSYIKDCTYFITDSFHGTAFALNFNKQFIEILPNNKTGSRNQSILRLTNLEDRIINDYNKFSICNNIIDYDRVNSILEDERIKSIDILKKLCSLI